MFRLLTTGHNPAATNMAIDEALIESISKGESPPTLRLYGWSPAAISIGYFQSLHEEIDLAKCAASGVEYVRRITGGGAVLHEDEITYSIHIPEKLAEKVMVPMGILESYRRISEGVLLGLRHFGIEGQFVPLNDIVVSTSIAEKETQLRKISGNAQTRKKGIILQHGTILLKVDVEKMFSLLKVPSEKMKGKLIEDVKQRVTSLQAILGREIAFSEAEQAFINGFSGAFSENEFVPGRLTENEKQRSAELAENKYRSKEWNEKR